jgi:hypothetical protein
MGVAESLLSKNRPVGGCQSLESSNGLGAKSAVLIPDSGFLANVNGINQNFYLGVRDGMMFILRPNPKGGYFELRTDVPAGSQPRQSAERAVKWFNDTLNSQMPATSNFLRDSGALRPQASESKLVKQKKGPPSSVTVSGIGLGNGAIFKALFLNAQLGNGISARFEATTATNVGPKGPSSAQHQALSLNLPVGLNELLIPSVSQFDSNGTKATTLALGWRKTWSVGNLSLFTENTIQGTFVSSASAGSSGPPTVAYKNVSIATYTAPLTNDLSFKASVGSRFVAAIGQPVQLQTSAGIGLSWKVSDSFTVEGGFGYVLPQGALNATSSQGTPAYTFGAGFRF